MPIRRLIVLCYTVLVLKVHEENGVKPGPKGQLSALEIKL